MILTSLFPLSQRMLAFIFRDQEFVYLIYAKFNSIGIVGAPPKECSIFLKETGKTYKAYAFATFTRRVPFFTKLHKEWYKKVDKT